MYDDSGWTLLSHFLGWGFLVLALVAAAIHILIFYMESIAWEGTLARKVFGGTPEQARPHAFYAFNQGFYNLFLAIQVILGLALTFFKPLLQAGTALCVFGLGSMLAAAVVLAAKSPAHRRAALKQGSTPALALAMLLTIFLIHVLTQTPPLPPGG